MSLQAVLSTLLNIGSKFYCHQCESEFRSRPHVTDPPCPRCGSEFVEVLENDEEEQTAGAGADSAQTQASGGTLGGDRVGDEEKGGASMEVDDDDPEPEVIDRNPREDHPYGSFGSFGSRTREPTDYRFPPGEPLITIRVPRPRPLALQIHEHIENLMAQLDREREAARERGEQQTDGGQATQESSQTTEQTGQTGQESSQTTGQTGQTSQTTGQTGQTSQESSQASQTSQQSRQTSQQTSQLSEQFSSSPPPSRRPRPDHHPQRVPERPQRAGDDPLADLHLSVGMPWYFMLHHRDHARREQPPPPARMQQFGSPIFLGFGGSGGARLHGSPADYVWGPQGVDNIISQMLASLEDPGPPPAEKEKINSLPTIEATESSVKDCTQCSVCKDTFAMGESLLSMPCSHLYHKDCILPWLKLHDTCPTCRFHLNTGLPDEHKGPV